MLMKKKASKAFGLDQPSLAELPGIDPGSVTKYFVDKGADLDMWSSMFFEGNPSRFGPGENATAGIHDFTQKSTRDERRKLVMNFWQD
jgi:hypothetical protein